MADLEVLVRRELRELLLSVEDELGPLVDVEQAVLVASSRWERAVDDVILPALRAQYVAAFRKVDPHGDVETAWRAFRDRVRPRLLTVPARLLRGLRAAAADAIAEGHMALAAVRDGLDDLSDDLDWRPHRIAVTEETSAVNAATYDAAVIRSGRTGESGVTVVWTSHHDERVRETHAAADGQERELGEPFAVGLALLRFPGDPDGPPDETVNCRCALTLSDDALTAGGAVGQEKDCCADYQPTPTQADADDATVEQAVASMGDALDDDGEHAGEAEEFAGGADRNRGGAEKLRRYWTVGPGGARIAWNTPGDFTRCVGFLDEHMPGRAEGYCANRHKEMTGVWPGDRRNVGASSTEIEETAVSDTVLTAATPGAEPVFTGLPNGWRGPITELGRPSDDKRTILRAGDAPRSRPLPMELGWQRSAAPGHDGAVTAGRIDRVWYETDAEGRDWLYGEGAFDLDGEDGKELARRVRDGFAGQVSVDLVDVTAEFRFMLPDGTVAAAPQSLEEFIALIEAGAQERMFATDWKLASTTFVSIPAFNDSRIEGVWGYKPAAEPAPEAALTAALAGEFVYPADAFAIPEADEPTPLTITDDGRVYGHAATWGQCHVGFPGQCVTPPRSETGYAHFHLGSVPTTEGDLAVGKVTVGGGHADGKAGVAATLEHYDNAATAVAVVRAHDGKHGIWLSGHIIDRAHPEDVAALRRSPVSGDWRRIGRNLELVAALAVNVPGFPVPRALAASVGTTQVSLVAAGAVVPVQRLEEQQSPTPALDARAFAREVLAAMREEQAAQQRAEALARRLGLDHDSRARALAARVGIEET